MPENPLPSKPATDDLLPPSLLAKLDRMELVSRKIFRGRMKGERRSVRKGQSVEFADFRNYVPGDDLRFVDWNLYARLDKLFLKLFLEEEDLHFYTLIDVSESMNFGTPSKLQYAKQLAAALGYIGLCRSDRIKIEPLDPVVAPAAPVLRGRGQVWQMLEYLKQLKSSGNVPLADCVKSFCSRNTGKGVLVLITDLMEKSGYETALKYLVARNLDIYVIHVLSQEEIDPDIQGDLKLVDCEDDDIAEISVSQRLLDRYRGTLATYIEQARDFCSRRGIVYTMTSTERSVDRLVSRYLRQRGLVR
ncbi:DUF58 domain-containing protein [Mariniblastus sp.]|nr:DUF58 domain-containing protein [Mariniblastus sp.]